MAMQAADLAPTADQVTTATRARERAASVVGRWRVLETTGLQTLNAKRRAAGQAPIPTTDRRTGAPGTTPRTTVRSIRYMMESSFHG